MISYIVTDINGVKKYFEYVRNSEVVHRHLSGLDDKIINCALYDQNYDKFAVLTKNLEFLTKAEMLEKYPELLI